MQAFMSILLLPYSIGIWQLKDSKQSGELAIHHYQCICNLMHMTCLCAWKPQIVEWNSFYHAFTLSTSFYYLQYYKINQQRSAYNIYRAFR